jgi:hypothetical protein
VFQIAIAPRRIDIRSLLPLSETFDAWKEGKISSGGLSERIHGFYQGPARELFKKYNGGMLEADVAHATVEELLDRTRVPTELPERCLEAR